MNRFYNSITRPTLLLDETIARKNIAFMAEKARRHNLTLEPHFKTHQSRAIGQWFRDEGIEGATVSSVTMAGYFVEAGWQKVMIAFPVNVRELDEIDRLASRAEITILLDSVEALHSCEEYLSNQVSAFIEIDITYHRTGLMHSDQGAITQLIQAIRDSKRVNLVGLYGHAGDTYDCRSVPEISGVHDRTIRELNALKKELGAHGVTLLLAIGDTPGCSVSDNFEGISIIRPGNYVFYDMTQTLIHSCNVNQVAVALCCPVVFKDESRNEVTVYGGGVHLSKDFYVENDCRIFGKPVRLLDSGWSEPVSGCYVRSVSQEHGVLKCTESFFDELKVGDLIGILPAHSCMTADLMGEYFLMDETRLDHMSGSRYPSHAGS